MNVSICHSEARQRRGIPGFLPPLSRGLKAKLLGITVTLLLPLASHGAPQAPTLRDFAWRQEITIEPDRALQDLAVPDAVYLNVLNDDLGDLRVFNQDGGVVAHALCAAPATRPVEPVLETVTPFVLQSGARVTTGAGGRIELRTADGTELTVSEPVVPTDAGSYVSGYVLDLRASGLPVRALQLDWQSADQASEASVSLKSSEDLDHWMTLMPSARLLRAQAGEALLQRVRIPLPERPYNFLRIDPGRNGPLPRIARVTAERVPAPDLTPAHWVEAMALPGVGEEAATAFYFDSARRAPVQGAELRLPATNMALGVLLQSRATPEQAWRTRWHGEVFALSSDNAQRGQTVAWFEPASDRYWRVEVQRGADTLRGMTPTLQLGYRPARLRFLTQGEGPFVLAYGSARAERRPPPSCDTLLATLSAAERVAMTGQAEAVDNPRRGNPDALKPLPTPTPLRQMLLWAVLVAGALLVTAMALSLLRRLRQE